MTGCLFDKAPSYHNSSIPSIHQHHEQNNEEERICMLTVFVSLTSLLYPLIFVTTGDMGKEATVFYIVPLLHGLGAHYFLCCVQLQFIPVTLVHLISRCLSRDGYC